MTHSPALPIAESDVGADTAVDSSREAILAARLDARLFMVVCMLLAVLTILFVIGLYAQWLNYRGCIDAALKGPYADHAAAISYSRALDAAFGKTSALFLGFLLVFTGTLYVLRSASAAYQLDVKNKNYGGHLKTSSPGLVIITLGVVLIGITIVSHSDINYDAPTQSPDSLVIERMAGRTDGQAVEQSPSSDVTASPSERSK